MRRRTDPLAAVVEPFVRCPKIVLQRTKGVTSENAAVNGLTEEQMRANRFEVVSRLADDLAHEIKNPLNAVVINLEVLRARVRKGAVDAALDRADVIESEVRRLHQLVDRMLQLLRPERDVADTLALDHVLDELLPLVEAQARLARNEFTTDCPATVFVPVRRDVLKFALLNLFTAVHDGLCEGGGTLSLQCETGDADVRLRIRAVRATGDRNDPDEDGVASAARIAGVLLGTCGGRVEHDGAGVTVVLPRATGA
jgi:signal transduction histidine kinase